MGGNDQVTGNGNTRLAFYNAAGGVTVDIASGTASGDASVGSDTFTGVNAIAGSWFDDTFFGTANGSAVSETFDGRNGNDGIDGRGGFDIAVYNNDSSVMAGISVDMAAGTVTGGVGVGSDTLTAIESVRGTNFADVYVATGFAGASTDFGALATFNEFEGMGGNDTITGNGNTRISYINASGGVTVDMVNGTASGNASVGTDTFTGVTRVRGSNANDTITGNGDNNIIEGRGGADNLTGGGGADTFLFVAAGTNGDSTGAAQDTIQDFLEGTDILSLSQIDANTAIGGDNAFLFVAAQTSAVQANSITWSQSGGNTIVRADINGDTAADLTFTLTGLKALTAADFLL
jgi:Ca2+-binding RTX toxin-like protein